MSAQKPVAADDLAPVLELSSHVDEHAQTEAMRIAACESPYMAK